MVIEENDNLVGQIYLGKGLMGVAGNASMLTIAGTLLPYPATVVRDITLELTTMTIADIPYSSDTTHSNIAMTTQAVSAGSRGIPFINLTGFTGLTPGKVYIIQTDNIIKIA